MLSTLKMTMRRRNWGKLSSLLRASCGVLFPAWLLYSLGGGLGEAVVLGETGRLSFIICKMMIPS